MHVRSAVMSWRNCVMTLPVTEHPKLWVGHYTDRLIGSTWAPRISGELVLILGSPFAVSDVPTTIIICDLLNELAISRLEWDGRGVRDTHWVAPYGRADDGMIGFGLAMPEAPVPLVAGAITALSEHRLLGSQYDFETAFGHAVQRGRELL